MVRLSKNTLIGLIVTSFIFTPNAFAKPQKVKTRGLNRVLKVIKKSKNGVDVSSFLESTKPIFKRRVHRRIIRDAFPYWDKKISKMVFRKNYVKVKYKGKTLFAKYVDRGPIAFIINNKPLLWKDMLTYRKTKTRLEEILSGKKSKKKVSALDRFFGRMSYFAFASSRDTAAKRAAKRAAKKAAKLKREFEEAVEKAKVAILNGSDKAEELEAKAMKAALKVKAAAEAELERMAKEVDEKKAQAARGDQKAEDEAERALLKLKKAYEDFKKRIDI